MSIIEQLASVFGVEKKPEKANPKTVEAVQQYIDSFYGTAYKTVEEKEKEAAEARRKFLEEQAKERREREESSNKTPSAGVSNIRYSLPDLDERESLSKDATRFFSLYESGFGLNNNKPRTFVDYLIDYINKSGMSNVEIYKRANLSKSVFSATISNRDRIPKKSTVIALAVALKLNLKETERLLMKAGYTFSNGIVGDLVVVYFINKNNYDIDEINLVLYELKQPLLGSK